MHARDVSMEYFGSDPQIATDIVKNSLGGYQFTPNEKNDWEGLFSAASNGISFRVREDVATAEAWAEVIDLLTEKLADTPYYPNARIHRIAAIVALLHFKGVDTSSKFRNPCRWIMEFDSYYNDWYDELENLLVNDIYSHRSDYCEKYLAEELGLLVKLDQYQFDNRCRSILARWVDLWSRQPSYPTP